MYQIEKKKGRYREDPWNIPLEERIRALKRAKEMRYKTVAFLYPRFDSSTFRYRGFNIAQTLEYSFHWSGICFQYEDRDELENELSSVDVLVMIRCLWDKRSDRFLRNVRRHQVKLCYDIDDLVYSPDCVPELAKSLGLKEDFELNFWFGVTCRYRMLLSRCDALITTNEYLAAHLRVDLDKPCFILKNYLNWFQESVSEDYFTQKQKLQSEDPFEIGYFSGSHTHVKDLMTALPEIWEFMQRHEDVRLKIVGHMDFPKEWDHLVIQGRVCFTPFQSFLDLQYEQARVDVNIVPLTDTVFSNCKSELKYFENAIVGTITCATPTYVFRNAIRSGENGYLCRRGEWTEALERIYRTGTDHDRQRSIRECALSEYAGKNQVHYVENVFQKILQEL